ncbi:type IV pilus modification protein PilV [Psychrobacter sp. ASPA161_9]|uniref:type IV pilus modification protein PilV n=1 Tax=Psychrobacter sp. ASPA161_9 TaxID=3160961 RepID=UPI003F823EAA
MKKLNSQLGVGLVEVLVAVLLLSVAVLGFSALQMRAISATDESLVRTKSLTIVRNLAEIMRAYPEAYVTGSGTAFSSVAPDTANAVPTIQAVVSSTATDTVSIDSKSISILATANNCLSTEVITDPNDASKKIPKQPCSINQLAARDALMVKKIAADEDIKVTVVMCPGTTVQAIQKQMCVITAWNDTKALLDNTDANACANSDGVYKTGNNCLISEAY